MSTYKTSLSVKSALEPTAARSVRVRPLSAVMRQLAASVFSCLATVLRHPPIINRNKTTNLLSCSCALTLPQQNNQLALLFLRSYVVFFCLIVMYFNALIPSNISRYNLFRISNIWFIIYFIILQRGRVDDFSAFVCLSPFF